MPIDLRLAVIYAFAFIGVIASGVVFAVLFLILKHPLDTIRNGHPVLHPDALKETRVETRVGSMSFWQ